MGNRHKSHSILSSNLLATHCPDFRGDFKGCETSSSILIPRGGLASLSSRGRCRSALSRRNPDLKSAGSSPLHLPKTGTCGPGIPIDWVSASVCLGSSGKIRVQLSFCRLEEVHQHSFESLPKDKCVKKFNLTLRYALTVNLYLLLFTNLRKDNNNNKNNKKCKRSSEATSLLQMIIRRDSRNRRFALFTWSDLICFLW